MTQWEPLLERKGSKKAGHRREQKEEGGAAGNCCAETAPSWTACCPSKGKRGAGVMCFESKGRQEGGIGMKLSTGKGDKRCFPLCWIIVFLFFLILELINKNLC